MLSILIPVYNFSVTDLVIALHKQCIDSRINFEIICCDDASEKSFHEVNSKLASLAEVVYKRLETNHGRSRIRNLLAREAKYDNLLFMDCDSEVVSENFISNYIQLCNSGNVICGGRVYDSSVPAENRKILRWKTGKRSEEINADKRSRAPYHSFMTNNFLIPKKIFLDNPLDEGLSGYGHEDTLLGFQLKRKNIPVLHISNPLKHIGLEDAQEFLSKTENGIANLLILWREKKINAEELTQIPLLKTYFNLKRMFLTGVFLFFFRLFAGAIKKNILSGNPSPVLFDVFKLGKLAQKALKN